MSPHIQRSDDQNLLKEVILTVEERKLSVVALILRLRLKEME